MEYLLSIAGFDPTSGAGVTRDIITFRTLGFYGLGVATAITFQNTQGFHGMRVLNSEDVKKQISELAEDFPLKFAKTGLLGSEDIATLVAEKARRYGWVLVVDPLLGAKNSTPLNNLDFMEDLFRVADIITPNIPEAEMISGVEIKGENGIIEAGEEIRKKYETSVLIKGGHGSGKDYLFDDEIYTYQLPLLDEEVHGTGCVHSSALLAFLAKGMVRQKAFIEARKFLQRTVEEAVKTGGYSLPR
jgi:hydroxymethylpyrimidine/phosphomethylpyrimidine kinase